MDTFRLKLADDGIGIDQIIEFDAENASSALDVLTSVQPGRRAELWHKEAFLCSITRGPDGTGVWSVGK